MVNGRLTAPPQHEAVLATNSVYGMVFEHAFSQLATRGTSLDTSSFGPHGCHEQRAGHVRAQRRLSEFGHDFPVTATHLPSVTKGVAARN